MYVVRGIVQWSRALFYEARSSIGRCTTVRMAVEEEDDAFKRHYRAAFPAGSKRTGSSPTVGMQW